MLRKLFKYEIKAMGRILIPLYGVWIAISAITGFIIANINEGTDKVISNGALAISTVSGGLYMIFSVVCVVCTVILVIQRFYKNLLGNEGYLTNTLPVSIGKHLFVKSINSTFWGCIGIIVGIISVSIMISLIYQPFAFNQDTTGFITVWGRLVFVPFNVLPMPSSYINKDIYFLQIIILFIVAIFETIVKVFAAISIGHIFNKKKVLISFAAYIAFGFIELIIVNIISRIQTDYNIIESLYNIHNVNIVLLIVILCIFALALAYYLVSYLILNKKLNIE